MSRKSKKQAEQQTKIQRYSFEHFGLGKGQRWKDGRKDVQNVSCTAIVLSIPERPGIAQDKQQRSQGYWY
ncbi:MAG: hypothetical protein ABI417_19885 [Coleofasciculaceae cyanobacterium]